ncbi:MAG TPA: FAD-binding oxidoreductase [Acidimicrobiales bacterium]|nr:FAD-binding oxidoreductase [Acidimicrobiales bacterium]
MVDDLVAIVGDEHVLVAPERVAPYLSDITEHPPGRADMVVRPGSRVEVVAVMQRAADLGMPVTPVIAGYNVAGIAIPERGGIVLDLTRLQGIEIDRDAMVVVVEPGVTFDQLKAHLDRECPELVYTYPFAPPFTSVMANALLDGLNNLSMPHGAMGKWVTGVEAVLADGSVVRTGSGAVVDSWFSRAPLPDLTGLFVSTQGTTGVVLRAGLQLVPRPAHRTRWFAFAWSLDDAYGAMRDLARTGSFDDVGLMTWPAAKLLFGATENFVRADDEPLAFLFVDVTGASPAELRARTALGRELLDGRAIDSVFEVEHLVRLLPGMAKLAELPTTLDFLLDFPGGGLAWVGSYGPGRSWVAGAHAGLDLLEDHGFPPFLVARPMDGGRYFVLRFVACFDRGDPADVERTAKCMGALADSVLDHGYVPYKASGPAAQRIVDRADPGFSALLTRVRDALDPDRRMNPGRWPGT